MKRILFIVVSGLLTVSSYFTDVSEKIISSVTKSDTEIEQSENKTLILKQFTADFKSFIGHSSHSSHRSHSSHSSHRSHYSSR